MTIKTGLVKVDTLLLYLTAGAIGLRGALVVITQEEEEAPHLIKAVGGQWQAKVHCSPLANFTSGTLFEFRLLHVALNCILPAFDCCRIV